MSAQTVAESVDGISGERSHTCLGVRSSFSGYEPPGKKGENADAQDRGLRLALEKERSLTVRFH
jgi:hypothetical protein